MAELTANEMNGVNDTSSPMDIDQEVPALNNKSGAPSDAKLCLDPSNGVDDDSSDEDSSDDDLMDYPHNNDYYSTTTDKEEPDPSPVSHDALLFKDCGGLDKQIKYKPPDNFDKIAIKCYVL